MASSIETTSTTTTFKNQNTTYITVDTNNNVGIGTIAPTQKLDVNGGINLASTNLLRWSNAGTLVGGIYIDNSNNMVFSTTLYNTERMRITSAGNVGIGAAETSLFNGAGTSAKLVVTGSNSNTNIVQNGVAAIAIVNTDQTDENTAGLHFARADTDDTPNYAGASIVAQFKETQATGQYPSATLNFLTSSSQNAAPTLKMTLDNAGSVGIGTDSPSTGYGGAISNVKLALKGAGAGGNNGTSTLLIGGDNNHYSYLSSEHTGGGATYLSFGTAGGASNPVERMRIDSSGKVGIGTTAPEAKLDIRSDIDESSTYTGQLAINSVTKSTGNLARMMFSHDNHGSASIASDYESSGNGNLIFSTRGGGNPTERMRIAANGKVGIGTTASADPLTVAGDIRIKASGGRLTYFNADGAYNLGVSGGAAIRFTDASGHQEIAFETHESGVSHAERMRITKEGNLKFNSGYGSAATAYGCRVWVNFNGQGTLAIRASGNVSSVTDVAVGNYRVNFTTAMPDVNYASTGTAGGAGADQINVSQNSQTEVPAVGSCRYTVAYQNGSAWDAQNICIAIFR
jgi:hypothetical protein